MTQIKDELAGLRKLLASLQPNGGMTMKRAGKDVTAQERSILEAEIKHLETVLKRIATT